ncbi:MAG TPA: hypothetical protein VFZ21_10640 [Gemmatimonadaceae bacterium]|jgi:hypothetical protein|nr:hypothetical protein [Gemmatimonadaceae bacterium]
MTRIIKRFQASLTVAIGAACLTLAACDDPPVAPEATIPEADAVPQQVLAAVSSSGARGLRPDAASTALLDVLERVLPTFEPGSSRTAIGAGLTQALASLERRDLAGARQALRAADQSLDVYARQADRALAPDIDAVRLAIVAGL